MYILGINESHTATAALLKDGEIIACASEERFTRKKGQAGFPKRAILYCLSSASISINDVSLVVFGFQDLFATRWYGEAESANVRVFFSVKRMLDQSLFAMLSFLLPLFSFYATVKSLLYRLIRLAFVQRYKRELANQLGLPQGRLAFADHHIAHALAAYYSLDERGTKKLIITNDGMGDDVCGRVFITEGDKWEEIASTPNHSSLAYLYFYITRYLGFTPNQDEFKVMGLAPYANTKEVDKLYPVFKKLIINQGLSFKAPLTRFGFHPYLQKHLQARRFDTIAGCIQRLTEELVTNQARSAIEQTGIRDVVLGGGLAMNIKANMHIGRFAKLRHLFVCPSSGDESTAIGACFFGYQKLCEKDNLQFKPVPVRNLYLGPQFGLEEVEQALRRESILDNNKFAVKKITKKAQAPLLAKLLAQGNIVARFAGRMEFGARALGNRSILADPRNPNIVKALNEQIKERDFWMPFAPTILAERVNEYLDNPKNLDSSYMMLGFPTTQKARKEIPAALHPADFTCRPQILNREQNPQYYDIIKQFEKMTGVSVLINTSFNLHGEPIVCTPQDAIRTFKRSGLQWLMMEDYLIRKVSSA